MQKWSFSLHCLLITWWPFLMVLMKLNIVLSVFSQIFYWFKGTPKVTLPSDPFYPSYWSYLSHLNFNFSVRLQPEFPPILEVKWQKIRGSTAEDINITSYSRYEGSTVDKKNPRLFIDQVTFDDDYREGTAYRCLARNSEGWGTSYNRSIWVIGSKFSVFYLLFHF